MRIVNIIVIVIRIIVRIVIVITVVISIVIDMVISMIFVLIFFPKMFGDGRMDHLFSISIKIFYGVVSVLRVIVCYSSHVTFAVK